jgi:hypothetical protein
MPDLLSDANVERLRLDRLANDTTADALHANSQRLVFTVRRCDVDFLQVGDEFSASDAGDFGTDTAQVLGLTAGFDAVAHVDFLAARFTLPCHRDLSGLLRVAMDDR